MLQILHKRVKLIERTIRWYAASQCNCIIIKRLYRHNITYCRVWWDSCTGCNCHGGDIGKVYEHVQQLDNENKYSLLKNLFVPTSSCKFPATADEYGKKKKVSTFLAQFSFPGLVYSPCTNGEFCKYCNFAEGFILDGSSFCTINDR